MSSELEFRKATFEDVEELSELFDTVCDYLQTHRNWPGWGKGDYPCRSTAEARIAEGIQYICLSEGKVVGALGLSHEPEKGYVGTVWKTPDDYQRIYMIYTFMVHPDYYGRGIGRFMLESCEELARSEGCISLRLDFVADNIPAEKLYTAAGFEYIETKSLGYDHLGLPFFKLYEKLL